MANMIPPELQTQEYTKLE